MIKLFLEIVRNNLFKYEMSERRPVLFTGKSRVKITNLKKKLHVREMQGIFYFLTDYFRKGGKTKKRKSKITRRKSKKNKKVVSQKSRRNKKK